MSVICYTNFHISKEFTLSLKYVKSFFSSLTSPLFDNAIDS